MSLQQIGNVEIFQARVYKLDAECHCPTGSTVFVAPGQYPLYSDGLTTFWVMRGQLNQRGIWRMGDGMFAAHQSDRPSEIEVQFASRRFGADEWADLLASPEFTEGDEAQRLRVSIGVSDDSAEAVSA